LIISANFKTFKTRGETKEYLEKLEEGISSTSSEVIVFPPLTALQKHSGRVTIGTQNSYPVENGAFTGEIGLEQLNEFDIKTILIGHSERREILGERQSDIAKKFQFFAERDFRIVYCIGEPLEVRKSTKEELYNYLKKQFEGIDLSYNNLVIAYEPIWAIGTGVTPTLEEIDETLSWIGDFSSKPILYGGSVKLGNIREILALNSCSGVLVGSASLNVDNFRKMIQIADEIEKIG